MESDQISADFLLRTAQQCTVLPTSKLNAILILSPQPHFKKMKPVNSPVGPERASWYSKLCDRIWHGSISDTVGYLVGTDFLLSEMFLRISLVIFLFCFHHHCLCNFYFSMLTQDSSFFNYLLISSLSAMCLRLDSYTTFYLPTLMLMFFIFIFMPFNV